MIKVIKNLISIVSFVLLVVIFVNKYQDRVSRIADIMDSMDAKKETVDMYKEDNLDEFENLSKLDLVDDNMVATKANVEVLKATPSEADIKFELKMKEFYDEIEKKGNADNFYHDNQNYIYELLKGTKFLGDSNVFYIEGYRVLPDRYVGIMKGESTTAQYDLIDKFIDENINNYVFWNGYNIKYFNDANEYVASYDRIVEKIKSINPNARVFITSLLPAREDVIKADMESDFTHNMYRGEEYDKALEEHFKDDYIDTKKMIIGERHVVGDGVHFDSIYYKMYVCYVAFEINKRNKERNRTETKKEIARDELENQNISKDMFGLFDIDTKEKYRFKNLELLYQCEMFEEIVKSDTPEKYFMEHINEWIDYLVDIKFCGDSNVNLIKEYSILPDKYVFGMPGKSLREQYDRIDQFDFKSCKKIILWNGFVIKEFKNVINYIASYKSLVEKIKTLNPDIEIYVCSLVPASKSKMEEDIEKGSPHDIYKQEEYNKALKEFFGDKYIDISVFVKDDYYAYDGYHLKDIFYKLAVPYLALYLECQELKNDSIKKSYSVASKSVTTDKTKKIFMTFDDGPSYRYTKHLLELLEQYDSKATFFVTAQENNIIDLLREINNKGHKIGAHTASHKYSIYKSVDTYFEDLYEIEKLIRIATGEFTDIIRFPGGSGNISSAKYCKGIMSTLVKLVEEMGYTYYDWNVSSGDGGNQESVQTLTNVINRTPEYRRAIILFHETKENTINMIEDYIIWGKENKYIFDRLENNTMICHQNLNN